MDLASVKESELLLSGYFTRGVTVKRSCGGKDFEIEYYQGDHANEYCVYEMKDGVRNGRAELFDDGMVKLRWTMKNGVRDGSYVLFDKGVVVREGTWNFEDNGEERIVDNTHEELKMVIRTNGEVVYEGDYNTKMERSGYGYEFENGLMRRYGKWEKDVLVELKQRFVSEKEMIEYASGSTCDLISHRPIYIGGYIRDEASGTMKRNGFGRSLDGDTGVCEYESEWENGVEKESKRVPLYNGWYHKHGTSESTRRAIGETEPILVGTRALMKYPPEVEELRVDSSDFNEPSMTELKLSGLTGLKRVVIGDTCFINVRSFELSGLDALETVVIGKKNFTTTTAGPRKDGSCRIVNCARLKSISLSDWSFGDYHAFELSNLPSLQSLQMGECCFYWSPSFALTSEREGWGGANRSAAASVGPVREGRVRSVSVVRV